MTSQLNVDTIVDKAGSGGTNVKMANTSTYVSDGGATTQNTVQGLGKTWHISNDAAGQEDSFNVASGTDNGTGDYTYAFTNNKSQNSYAHPHTTCIVNCAAWSHTRATSSMRIAVFYDEGGARDARTHGTVHGDLA